MWAAKSRLLQRHCGMSEYTCAELSISGTKSFLVMMPRTLLTSSTTIKCLTPMLVNRLYARLNEKSSCTMCADLLMNLHAHDNG